MPFMKKEYQSLLFFLLIDELSELPVAEAILQLFDLFHEAFIDEHVLDKATLNNIIEPFITKLSPLIQNQLKQAG